MICRKLKEGITFLFKEENFKVFAYCFIKLIFWYKEEALFTDNYSNTKHNLFVLLLMFSKFKCVVVLGFGNSVGYCTEV